jgi:hypothetical protein
LKPLVSNDSYHDESAYENGALVPVANDHSGEELINRCAAECGISTATAMDAMQFYDENFATFAGGAAASISERDRHWWFTIEKIFDLMLRYMRQQEDPRMLKMTPRAMALALGFRLTAGADSPAALARTMGMQRVLGQTGKQTVNKCVQKFIRQLRLARIPGQRDEESRERMKQRRIDQLQPKPHHANKIQETEIKIVKINGHNPDLHRESRPVEQEGNGNFDRRRSP